MTKSKIKIIKELDEMSLEFLQCPYCGVKMQRIEDKFENKMIKPTSCEKCNHHNFTPTPKRFLFMEDIKDILGIKDEK